MQVQMKHMIALALLGTTSLLAQDQSTVGAGNAAAAATSAQSPMVQSAMKFIADHAKTLSGANLRAQTLDGLLNPNTCIRHRANLKAADKQAIVQALLSAGLLDQADGAAIPGGLVAGVFPGVVNDGTACPQLPMPFYAAPGSAFGSHHSYPGGLPVHEANNDEAAIHLATEYRAVYGVVQADGLPVIVAGLRDEATSVNKTDVYIAQDLIVGAPLWHDWAKPIVFQWNADGTEYKELSIGDSTGSSTLGAAKTGGHHILSIAEGMKRGFSPAFVITQASAHSAPSLGNEYKVVNWIRAAAIIAQIDPLAAGFLTTDATGAYRLPALRQLGEFDLPGNHQSNLLVEYQLHNLSDADFTESIPAVTIVQAALAELAPLLGYDPANVAVYNTKYRNVVFSYLTAERLHMLYAQNGLGAILGELSLLKSKGLI